MKTAIDKTSNLAEQKIPKLVLSFFATTIIGLVLNSLYNLTDTLFVSRGIGDIAMGGVAIVIPFTLMQGAISTMIGSGAATVVSMKLSEKKYEEAGNYTFNAMIFFYIISTLITVICLIFVDEILILLGAKGDLYNYAKDYFTIILIGNVFSTGFSSIIRAEGKIWYGLLIWVIPITLNIILDALFILVLGWGVKGSAYSTIFSQFVSFVFSVVFFTRFSVQKFTHLKLQLKNILKIFKIGAPSLIQVANFSIMTAILNIILSKISGSNEIIAFGYIGKLLYYLIVPFVALAQASGPIISYNFGQNTKRVKETVLFCLKISFIYAIFAFILVEAIPKYLLMIFTDNIEIINIAKMGLRIVAISLFFMPLPMLIGTKFQASGKTLNASLAYGSSFFFIILPAIFLSKAYQLNGVWISYVIAHLISTLFVLMLLVFNKKQTYENEN